MDATNIILIVAGVGYVLVRRWRGELLEAKRLLLLPLILTVIGATSLHNVHPVDALTVGFIALGCAASVLIGLARGLTVHLGERGGVVWMRYRASTIGLWVLNLAVKLALLPVEHAVAPASASAADTTLLFAIGLGIVAETLVVLYRAMRTESTLVWAKGKDGQPHQSLPALDQIRTAVQHQTLGGWTSAHRDW